MNARLDRFKKGDTVLVQKPEFSKEHDFIFEGVIEYGDDSLFRIKLLKPDGTIESYLAWKDEIIIRVD